MNAPSCQSRGFCSLSGQQTRGLFFRTPWCSVGRHPEMEQDTAQQERNVPCCSEVRWNPNRTVGWGRNPCPEQELDDRRGEGRAHKHRLYAPVILEASSLTDWRWLDSVPTCSHLWRGLLGGSHPRPRMWSIDGAIDSARPNCTRTWRPALEPSVDWRVRAQSEGSDHCWRSRHRGEAALQAGCSLRFGVCTPSGVYLRLSIAVSSRIRDLSSRPLVGSAALLEAMNDQAGWSRTLKREVGEGTDRALWLNSTQDRAGAQQPTHAST